MSISLPLVHYNIIGILLQRSILLNIYSKGIHFNNNNNEDSGDWRNIRRAKVEMKCTYVLGGIVGEKNW